MLIRVGPGLKLTIYYDGKKLVVPLSRGAAFNLIRDLLEELR